MGGGGGGGGVCLGTHLPHLEDEFAGDALDVSLLNTLQDFNQDKGLHKYFEFPELTWMIKTCLGTTCLESFPVQALPIRPN